MLQETSQLSAENEAMSAQLSELQGNLAAAEEALDVTREELQAATTSLQEYQDLKEQLAAEVETNQHKLQDGQSNTLQLQQELHCEQQERAELADDLSEAKVRTLRR